MTTYHICTCVLIHILFTIVLTIFIFKGLAIFARCPSAYEALKNFGILNLPIRSPLIRQGKLFNQDPGEINNFMLHEMEKYVEHTNSTERKDSKKPLGIGVLIFDEVKVISKVLGNSKNHKFLGTALNDTEQATLCDLYTKDQSTDQLKGSSYMIQFIWRDLTSKYDMIGPIIVFHTAQHQRTFHKRCRSVSMHSIVLTSKSLELYVMAQERM